MTNRTSARTRIHRNLTRAVICLVGVGMAGCQPTEVLVAESDDEPSLRYALSAAELEDVQFIAASNDWTLDEAMERVGWQPRFAELVGWARATYPDEFAGAAATPEGPGQARLQFKGDVPAEIARDPRLRGIDVQYRSGLGYSEAELHGQQLEVHQGLLDAGFVHVVSSYDIDNGEVDVELGANHLVFSPRELEDFLPEAARAPNVNISIVEPNDGELYELFGGGSFEMAGGSDNVCTAGVMVSDGVTDGMLTAGHCADALTLENTRGATEHTATFIAQHGGFPFDPSGNSPTGDFGDFQWHSFTTDVPSTSFFQNFGVRREAWSVRTAFRNATLCRFGQVTGKHCDEVFRTNVSSGADARLVAMRNDNGMGGDSGGPWYLGNSVYGIEKGSRRIWFKKRELFSQLIHVGSALGVTVSLCQRRTCQPGDCGHVSVGCGATTFCGECDGECESYCPNGSCCPESGVCVDDGVFCGF